MRVTSKKGIEFIGNEEGLMLKAYKDQVGKWTIGYGHLIPPGSVYPNGICKWQALEMLAADVKKVEDAINSAVHVPLTQNQFDALVSLGFNIGVPALVSSTLVKRLNDGDFGHELTEDNVAKPKAHLDVKPGAVGQFAVWRMAAGAPLPVLVGRRAREAKVFLAPDDGVFLAG